MPFNMLLVQDFDVMLVYRFLVTVFRDVIFSSGILLSWKSKSKFW